MRLRLLDPADLAPGLADALAGGGPVAPVPEPAFLPAIAVDQPVMEEGAAAVVATSGSTGQPRAVVLGADAIRFAANATHDRLGGPGDWVCALPTQHVAGLMTIARAVVAQTRARFARGDLADLPEVDCRTYLSLVVAQLDRALADSHRLSRLRQYAAVLLGGSAVPRSLVKRAIEAGVNVVTTYGMSETCGGCVYDGRPLGGVRVEVEDGRISLGGPMAFLGYRLRPELTEEVLRGDLVRTSDRGRWSAGVLEVLGRMDDVVVTGGAKVDLATVQRVCDEEFGRGTLAVLATPDERWGSRIVAVATRALGLLEVQDRLAPRVGLAAVPREIRPVATIEVTSLGKIDGVALRRSWEKGEHGDLG